MLRVGLLCGDYEPALDGVADYTRRLADELRVTGVRPVVLTTRRLALAARDPHVIGVSDGWHWPGVTQAARAIRRLALDVLHVQYSPSVFGFTRAIGALPLLLRDRPPTLVTLHEYGEIPTTRLGAALWRAAERRGWLDRDTGLLVPRGARVVVTNDEHADLVRARVATLDGRLVRVPIGPNIPVAPLAARRARRSVREELGVSATAPIIVFFGFLHPVKRLDHLVTAAARLTGRHPELRVLVIGGSHSHSVAGRRAAALRRRLLDTVHRHGMTGRLRATGHLPEHEVSRLLRAADLAVFPFAHGVTLKSSSLLAALDHGLPVVATATRPVAAPVEDGGVLWVRRGDVDMLTTAIRRVVEEPALARRLRAGAARAARRHQWCRIAAAHVDLYRDVHAASVPAAAATWQKWSQHPHGARTGPPAPRRI